MPRLAAAPLEGPFEGRDTSDLALEAVRRHLGPALARAGLVPTTREDLGRVVSLMKARFGV